jgi:hypothetical protein
MLEHGAAHSCIRGRDPYSWTVTPSSPEKMNHTLFDKAFSFSHYVMLSPAHVILSEAKNLGSLRINSAEHL